MILTLMIDELTVEKMRNRHKVLDLSGSQCYTALKKNGCFDLHQGWRTQGYELNENKEGD